MSKVEKTVGIIGCGNMGSAMARGMAGSGVIDQDHLILFDLDEEKVKDLARQTGGRAACDMDAAAEESDILILAVKPYVYASVLESLSGKVKKGAVILVIAVGISFEDVREKLGEYVKVVRVQPSTPAMVLESDTTFCPDGTLTEEEREDVRTLLASFGAVEELSEELMDVVPGIASSAPAYALMLIEAMADGGVLHGFPRDQAIRLSAQSVLGAAKMVLETGEHPAVLKDMICTPGGTTIEAVKTLEENGFRKAVIEAVDACARKSKDMMKK